MDPQEGDIADLPDGREAVFQGGRWVVRGAGRPQSQGWRVQPVTSPSEQRADQRLTMAEETQARQARSEERQIEQQGQTLSRQGFQDELGLKQQFDGLPEIREFPVVRDQYEIIKRTANESSPAGDLALVTAYMKMLDPGSVVREQEFSNAANAGGAAERARALLSDITGNGILTPKQRRDFVAQSRGIYEVRATGFNQRATEFRSLAEQRGFAPDNIAKPIEIDMSPISVNREPISEDEANDPNLLSAQGYKYDGERDVWFKDPGSGLAAEQIVADAREADGKGVGRQINAVGRGIADGATFGFADEIAAGLNTVLPLDRGSRGGFQDGFGNAYDHNLRQQRAIDNADEQDAPIARAGGQLAGAVAAPGAVAGGRYIAAAPNLMTAGMRGAQVGALSGAAYGAGASEGDRLTDAGRGAMTGALIGAPLGAGGRAVGQVVSRPMTSARGTEVQTLLDNGVSLTPGQRLGGLAMTTENLAQRAPILGPAIRGARERGRDSLNRAVGNRALDAIGEGVPAEVAPGGDMVGYVGERLGGEFDRAYALVPTFRSDDLLEQGFQRIGQGKSDLPPAMQQQFDAIVSERLGRLSGEVSGQQVGAIRTELNGLASGYLKSQDPAQQGLGRMLSEVGDELDAAVTRNSPEAGQILSNARDGYADFTRMQSASAAANGRPFAPGQLATAVKTADGTVRRGATARGDARMQDLSRAAQTVMPDQFGNPGTADAVGLGGLGVGLVTEPVTTTAVAAGLGAAATPYFMMGRKVVEKLPPNASRQALEGALGELDQLARQDSNVIVLRDEIARRIGQGVPAAAQQTMPEPPRLMTGTRGR